MESEAASFEDRVAGVGLDGGPNGKWAVVNEGENEARVSVRVGECEEEKGGCYENTERRSHFCLWVSFCNCE